MYIIKIRIQKAEFAFKEVKDINGIIRKSPDPHTTTARNEAQSR